MPAVELSGVKKSFGSVDVIRSVDLAIERGEFVVFVGPSGCGKSTLLRLIAGLETLSGGTVRIEGMDVSRTPPARRGVAMVFQSYALFPHMTVAENISFGLRLAREPRADIDRRVAQVAETLQLTPLLSRRPKQLSGGQRQRVAIGRAIIRNPKVFLFDEPLSNLDAALRSQMRVEIARLHADLKATMIYVTHDQVEAMTLADRIVVVNAGRIEQVGTPMELYSRPVNRFVAGFIGSPKMNFLDGTTTQNEGGGVALRIGDATFPLPQGFHVKDMTSLTIGLRPEDITLEAHGRQLIGHGRLVVLERLGGETLGYYKLPASQDLVTVKHPRTVELIRDADVPLYASPDATHVFDDCEKAIGRRTVHSS